ncbi:MAG: sigma 54-interacting transcriptional regulator [Planctomycetes bacterium]|nr:sigma 54-interacting transcriptional regulator [Planctomycetota bacterium]
MNREQLDLQIINAISRKIGSTLELEEIFDSTMSILAERLKMKRGTLVLCNGPEMKIVAAHGLDDEEIGRGRYALGEGITGRVVDSGMPIFVSDIRTDPLFLNRTGARRGESGPVSFVCVPLKYGNTTIGALSVDKDFTDAETLNRDKNLLMILGAFIAQAVKMNEMVQRERAELVQENTFLREELRERYRFDNMVGASSTMRKVFETVGLVARSRATVLIRGETGTGKELVARSVHYNSPRRTKPWVGVSCAALTNSLLESELFGHVKGAFTGAFEDKKGRFETAHGGTLFLDEIGDMSESLQVKLLRVLQERQFERVGGTRTIEVDIRLIAATNRNLEEDIRSGAFREDLYYRLNVVPIYIPPLRERREDIPLLIKHFLDKYCSENKKNITGLAPGALDILMHYHWPGNVRELESCIEMAVVMATENRLTVDVLPPKLQPSSSAAQLDTENAVEQAVNSLSWSNLPRHGLYKELVPMIERGLVQRALAETKGVKLRAAQILGINRNTLHKKIVELGIETS